jgi:hypothetical protein
MSKAKSKCSCGSGLKPERCCHGPSSHDFDCNDCGKSFPSEKKKVVEIGNSSHRAKRKRISLCQQCSEKRVPTTFIPSKVYKYIHFVEIDSKTKTKVYSCRNSGHDYELGRVQWHVPWRQYCFYPDSGTIFNVGCLLNITHFIDQINNAHKKEKNEESK